MNYANNLALFLLDKTGSIYGRWKGKLTAAEQRALYGRFLGKGTVYVDGADETVEHWVKVGFGLDADPTTSIKWKSL